MIFFGALRVAVVAECRVIASGAALSWDWVHVIRASGDELSPVLRWQSGGLAYCGSSISFMGILISLTFRRVRRQLVMI